MVGIALGLAVAAAGVLWVRSGSEEPLVADPPLGAQTSMGAVELLTDDLPSLQTFYTNGVGLSVLSESEDRVALGRGDRELLILHSGSGSAADRPSEAGLYHSAFLFPTEADLAVALVDVVTVAPGSFAGASDHRVSQAFYFADPDGNGVELYVDRPESTWTWEDGEVVMGSAALDANAFVNQHLPAEDTDGSAESAITMGHVHLRVGDLVEAERFYAGLLGFEVTSRSDGATFMAAGGYHHHLAVNTWSSEGARQRPATLGLSGVRIHLSPDDLDAVQERLTEAGLDPERDGAHLTVTDPWGTPVHLIVD